MTDTITLPAIANEVLQITVDHSGKLLKMAWPEGNEIAPDIQAQTVALERAKMFKGGRLSLPQLLDYIEVCRQNEESALTETSRVEDYDRNNGGHVSPYSDKFNSAERASDSATDKTLRARAWIRDYRASSGMDLALVVIAMLGTHNAPIDLDQNELISLRNLAQAVVSGVQDGAG